MLAEPSSTVKHVKWMWPDCLVGEGQPTGDSDRGVYNVSSHVSPHLESSAVTATDEGV